MDVFDIHQRLVRDYSRYIRSFIQIANPRIRQHVEDSIDNGLLWPDPLIQLNPAFEPGEWIDDFVKESVLHPECSRIFRIKSAQECIDKPLRLHRHQADAVRAAKTGKSYVLTTGTGSGKSLAYIVPIVDHVLRRGSGQGVQAIVVYPMNALANSQELELQKFLQEGYAEGQPPVRFALYTGQESDETRQGIMENPPDIILTNYVMLELMLTRTAERPLIAAAQNLRFLVLDELHTYRGRQGADVGMLIRRVRDRLAAPDLQCVGTSATLAGPGDYDQQREEVAQLASRLFGSAVLPENVIGETLRRATPERSEDDPAFVQELSAQVLHPEPPGDYSGFTAAALSSWIESRFGVRTDPQSRRIVRAAPCSLTGKGGAAGGLSKLTGAPVEQCQKSLQQWLLAGYTAARDPETGFPVFAFRLHQFISRGDTVYSSLEGPPNQPYLTVQRQRFVPGDREKILLPLVFCRECGQEYFTVRKSVDESGTLCFEPRDWPDDETVEGAEEGFLHFNPELPWPDEYSSVIERLPEDWLEERNGEIVLRKDRRKDVPQPFRVGPDGKLSNDGVDCHYFRAFRFCLRCGVAYNSRQTNDFFKLAVLGSEGRSTATTILSLSAVQALRENESLPPQARKLLSFTDNRQDASLQAGHFNDFIEIGLLRSALYCAAAAAGPSGIRHEELTQRVFDAMDLPRDTYASDPGAQYGTKSEAERALREVLGYRLYSDLKRGWRITSPNLEQCGLLSIDYRSLDEMCGDQPLWDGRHPALLSASPDVREKVARVLLDYMRQELAIKVDYLDRRCQEGISQLSSQCLVDPWAIDENEKLHGSTVICPRSRKADDTPDNVCLSPRGGFGQYLRRRNTFPDYPEALSIEDARLIIVDLLDALNGELLTKVGIETSHRIRRNQSMSLETGYQLKANAMIWTLGNGSTSFHDIIRVPNEASVGGRTNPFFVDFYRDTARSLLGLEAREHTAQVPYQDRQEREKRFREGTLPVMYCSPTMELGVDISSLNAVNMRNIPPTPANYAQRSGRAGRSGQPAIVFAYCSKGSSHDQYFFKRPELMVAGAVTPPRLDLANEDLIRAHVHAVWLSETGQSLGHSLPDVLDLSDAITLPLQSGVVDSLESVSARQRAYTRASRILAALGHEMSGAGWFSDEWLGETLQCACRNLDQACERWRGLYRAAQAQFRIQSDVILNHAASQRDKDTARRLRREAEEQLNLLTQVDSLSQSDFYSYRYFASEGFLPGYNFPRLPLAAYIGGRKGKQRDEFIQRPRFLAIKEFGPQAFIYHEGSRYQVNRVILPPTEDDSIRTRTAKICAHCGYLHPLTPESGADVCDRCGQPLGSPLTHLFRMQNVAARRRDRINSDEEERMRRGYTLVSGVRFSEHQGSRDVRVATVIGNNGPLAELTYGHSATLWRINMGWSRRAATDPPGFLLDIDRGYWEKREKDDANDDAPDAKRKERVIPFVEDTRNCLILEPTALPSEAWLCSLQSALKSAIQVEFQLEDSELAAEPLPTSEPSRMLLFYESAEGGAGVLRRLVEDPTALPRVCRTALELCHFDPDSGDDRHHAPRAVEDCEAACYDCLMTYGNQPAHRILDRRLIKDDLLTMAEASIQSGPTARTRPDQMELLLRMCGSDLEREWLAFIEEGGYTLPEQAQTLIEKCGTRPDFVYRTAVVYVDGPHHVYPERHTRDQDQQDDLEDAGYTVVRFGLKDDWNEVAGRYPWVFGKAPERASLEGRR